ncbi:hypothetical protein [Hirschia maritima]|uniref:hypothetical protein n=1 Tax=Hirschia maritima TaxID=1121961 RepID=UPI000372F36C|nr:hypothetical protein [Hirschia maritima]
MHIKIFAMSVFILSVGFAGTAFAQKGVFSEETKEQLKARSVLNTEFNPDQEANLAVMGAPEHLRDDATIYVYTKSEGYKLHRQGKNEFICLVNRDAFFYGTYTFKPTCWDREGHSSYVPVMLSVGKWLAEGLTTPVIKQKIESSFRNGIFHSSEKTGIAYMIAGDVLLDLETGKVTERVFPGHHMLYAPGVTSVQMGTKGDVRQKDETLPFVFAEGAGGSKLAYIINSIGCVKY